MPYKSDPWYKSKRLYAAVLMVVAMMAGLFGWTITEEEQAAMAEILATVGTGIAALLAIISKILEKGKMEDEE